MSQRNKTLLLWGLLVVMFVAVWQFMAPSGGGRGHEGGATPWWVVAVAAVAVLGVTLLVLLNRTTARVREVNRKFTQATRARDERGCLDAVAGVPRLPTAYAVYADYLRGEIAFEAGRFEEAVAAYALAARHTPIVYRRTALDLVAMAHGRRGLALAALDREGEARAAVAAAYALEGGQLAPSSVAALAEVVLDARRGDLDAARKGLERLPALRQLAGRERALLWALQTFAQGTSAYRRPACATDDPGEDDIEERAWAERLVPGIGSSVRSMRRVSDLPRPAAPTDPAVKERVAAVRDPLSAPKLQKGLVAWLPSASIAVVAGLAYAAPAGQGITVASSAAGVAFFALAASWYVRGARAARALREAADADVQGEPERALLLTKPLVASRDHGKRARALAVRARFELHLGDATRALETCNIALRHLAAGALAALQTHKPKETTLPDRLVFTWGAELYAEIVTVRASALAALGVEDEALFELSLTPADAVFSTWIVELYRRVAANDADGIVELADRSGLDVAVARPFEEALVFAARAATGDGGARAWLERELARTPAIERFMSRLAPRLLAAAKA